MSQLIEARSGKITPEMKAVAKQEGIDAEEIRKGVAQGKIVIPHNQNGASARCCGIGKSLRTKVNANLGMSPDYTDLSNELKKLEIAVEYGADAVMDLSVGGDLDQIRRRFLDESPVIVGTNPIYQSAVEAVKSQKCIPEMSEDDIFRAIQLHASDGVDFITVHCGTTLPAVEQLKQHGRLTGVVSRGGAFLVEWMIYNEKENPLYMQFDRLLDIALKYDVTLSLGDGLRPGCLADATDRAQVQELIVLGELAQRARVAGVQVMIEGPGHVPLNQIEANILLEKRLCKGAPFFVLGPLVTDVAPGYDHITSAIGGAIAAAAGADLLCYVTPSEHLSLPTLEDVKNGVIASRIAAHAADISKGVKGAIDWDIEMAKVRKKLDWQNQIRLSIDPKKAARIRSENLPAEEDVCTMCGKFCAMKGLREYFTHFR